MEDVVEQVRLIDGFDNYTVSESGVVTNIKTGRILKACLASRGYLIVVPHVNGKPKTMCIHQLVAKAFIPNNDNLPCVDHKNNDRTDNRIENLRWVGYSENNKNRIGCGDFLNDLPEGCIQFNQYNGHMFVNYFINQEDKQLYEFNGIKYRKLITRKDRNNLVYWLQNTFHRQVSVSLNQLKLGFYN